MNQKQVEALKTEVNMLGPQTRSCVLISMDHEGVGRVFTQGQIIDISFQQSVLAWFINEVLSGKIKIGPGDVQPPSIDAKSVN
jgi:hypothetical protein